MPEERGIIEAYVVGMVVGWPGNGDWWGYTLLQRSFHSRQGTTAMNFDLKRTALTAMKAPKIAITTF